mmetsp:Transcript_24772/g.59736  ORF Transcript_24772/g.59736 Transcript_24772/m.59736 type:complete len:103 (+) Transcript_24772:103-411(+)
MPYRTIPFLFANCGISSASAFYATQIKHVARLERGVYPCQDSISKNPWHNPSFECLEQPVQIFFAIFFIMHKPTALDIIPIRGIFVTDDNSFFEQILKHFWN